MLDLESFKIPFHLLSLTKNDVVLLLVLPFETTNMPLAEGLQFLLDFLALGLPKNRLLETQQSLGITILIVVLDPNVDEPFIILPFFLVQVLIDVVRFETGKTLSQAFRELLEDIPRVKVIQQTQSHTDGGPKEREVDTWVLPV